MKSGVKVNEAICKTDIFETIVLIRFNQLIVN
jgi:hypothetical protein